ncbi:hypothetical protein NNJEOMEG_03166 [Fundidesulfovibrio magnetotacticus]|uniref:Major facilitator superfamily (MFS) profile domain-containing protein n=1 Tax=Fundidesulfovibrio magnetotacticus TaxID=2730080 RepID=A0A6V8M0C4_9BACT|nr:MFS transporter [Fundidesulfovibrio magnetotacticus]GFK95307.1 hypothetical protein NNJEOMEG_03166 [Fundidesulfovibrio magnetotacticus]
MPDHATPAPRRTLLAACLAHLAHDGFTDMLYVFFPVWQGVFALSYAQVGLMKSLYSGTLALCQIPAGMLAGRLGPCRLLVVGTLLASAALFLAGTADTAVALGGLLALGGVGASVQHPLASAAIAQAYAGQGSRVALSTYNFVGDMGKLLLPAAAGILLARMDWQNALQALSLAGVATGLALPFLFGRPARGVAPDVREAQAPSTRMRDLITPGFVALNAIGVLDSATRMGLLTFLPFLLREKGADMNLLGIALGLVFAGGCAGKLVCGVVASRAGVLRSIIVTEACTAPFILALPPLPLWGALCLCPILGMALNGTSSALYGSVPELIPRERRGQAFAVYYTAAIGAGAAAPYCYGMLSDALGLQPALQATGLTVLAAIPLTLPLRGRLSA